MSSKYPDPYSGVEDCPDWCDHRRLAWFSFRWDERWLCNASRIECEEYMRAIQEKMKEEMNET